MEGITLIRPIVFFDLETTGVNPRQDRIVEISVIKCHPDGMQETKSVRVNPGIPIPEAAKNVHGITDDDVVNEPGFAQYAKSFLSFLEDCDLAGFNVIRFDLPLLQEEFKRVGLELDAGDRNVVDPMVIFHEKEPRDLSAAYRKYCGKDLEGAHASMSDAEAARDILVSQIAYYPDLATTVDDLHLFCNPVNPDWIDSTGRLLRSNEGPVLGFGKHEGTLLADVVNRDPDYLDWIIGQDFDDVVKTTINEFLQPGESSSEEELFPS